MRGATSRAAAPRVRAASRNAQIRQNAPQCHAAGDSTQASTRSLFNIPLAYLYAALVFVCLPAGRGFKAKFSHDRHRLHTVWVLKHVFLLQTPGFCPRISKIQNEVRFVVFPTLSLGVGCLYNRNFFAASCRHWSHIERHKRAKRGVCRVQSYRGGATFFHVFGLVNRLVYDNIVRIGPRIPD